MFSVLMFIGCPQPVSSSDDDDDDDTTVEKGGFTILNSWGKGNWENVADGKYVISYAAVKKNPIMGMVWGVSSKTPKVLLKFKVSTDQRDNLFIKVSGAQSISGEDLTGEVWTKNFIKFSTYNTDGFGDDLDFSNAEMCIDITDIYNALTSTAKNIYVFVYNKDTSQTITVHGLQIDIYNSGYTHATVATASPDTTKDPGTGAVTGDTVNANSKNIYEFIDMINAIPAGSVMMMKAGSSITGGKFVMDKPTSSEISRMKRAFGVYDSSKNYNKIYKDRFGTGMKPPREEWYNSLSSKANYLRSFKSGSSITTKAGASSVVDISQSKYFPPVGNQGYQGSCVSFNSGYYVQTYNIARINDWDLSGVSWDDSAYPGSPSPDSSLDKIISPKFIYNLVNGGVDEGSFYSDNGEVITQIGSASWGTLPYLGGESEATAQVKLWPGYDAFKEAPLFKASGYVPDTTYAYAFFDIDDDSSIQLAKDLLAAGYCLITAVDAYYFDYMTSADAFTSKIMPSYWETNHANTIVGYNDSYSF